MFVSHDQLLWMLRQVDGQRINKDKLLRKLTNHGISSLLPYFDGIESFFDRSNDKHEVLKKVARILSARVNAEISCPDHGAEISFSALEKKLSPLLIQSLQNEAVSALEENARVMVRLDSSASYIKPGSEGFITEKLPGTAKVRFYSIAGRYGADIFSMEVPDEELQVVAIGALLGRHQDFNGVAEYFLNDSVLRAMKSSIDSSIYSHVANLALEFLANEGFVKISGDEIISVPSRIFSVIAPKLDATYNNKSLFSSHSLSAPPSERKPHVLRLVRKETPRLCRGTLKV